MTLLRNVGLRARYFTAFTICAWLATLGRGRDIDDLMVHLVMCRFDGAPGQRRPK